MYSVKTRTGEREHILMRCRDANEAYRYARDRAQAMGLRFDVPTDKWVRGDIEVYVDEE